MPPASPPTGTGYMKATLTHSAGQWTTCSTPSVPVARHDMVAGMKLSYALRRAGKQHIASVDGSPREQGVDLLAWRDRHLRKRLD